ncbi:hypothetical protein C8R46DRAFT_1353956 [Mycena filopes]|nr:hypothetical protein C8R46DRAFT_1353956 [Mycena filopes]
MGRRKRSAKKKTPPKDLQDLLVSGLQLEPGALCITGLANCCDKILHPRTTPATNKVLRAAMQFLARERTLEEQMQLKALLFQCNCDLKDSFIASLHEPVSNVDPLNFAILELSFAIMDALSPRPKDAPIPDDAGKDLDQIVLGMADWNDLMEVDDQLGPLPSDWVVPEELKPKVAKPAIEEDATSEPAEVPWPSGPEDVLPSTRTMAQILQSLLLWSGEPSGGSGIFLLISRLSDYSPSFAAAIPDSPIAIPCALVHLQYALDAFQAHAPPNTFRLAIAAVTNFLHHMPKARFLLLLTTYRDLFLDIAVRIQPALAEMPGAEAVFAKAWWAQVRIGIDAGPEFPWENYGRRPGPPPVRATIGPADLWHLLWTQRAHSRCNKPDCPNRLEPPKTMMFCRRCAVACYCSETCQKQAWSKCTAPHKPLCNAVDELRRAMGLQVDAQWKAALTRRDKTEAEDAFTDLCRTKTVALGLLKSVADRLAYHNMTMDAMDPSVDDSV